jgi:hypothetical protein
MGRNDKPFNDYGRKIDNLVGRLLTLADATFNDSEQRDAQKILIRQNIWAWFNDEFGDQGVEPSETQNLDEK